MNEAATAVIQARARDRESWSGVVVVSVLGHIALAAGIVWLPQREAKPEAPKTVMSISLGGAPGPRAGGMTPMGGRAVQQVAPPEVKPRAEAPPAAKPPAMTLPSKNARPARPDVKPAVTSEAASGRRLTTGEEVREGTARAETGARGQGFGLTGGGGAGAGAYLDVGDFCCPEYLETVVQTIQRNWASKQGATGQTLMKFTIDRTGVLTDVLVERPSGFAALDTAASRALLLTQRVPPLPGAFPNPNLTVHLKFEYQR